MTAQEHLKAHGVTHKGKASMGRPLQADPEMIRQWKQENTASLAVTAEHFKLSLSTIKRYCAVAVL